MKEKFIPLYTLIFCGLLIICLFVYLSIAIAPIINRQIAIPQRSHYSIPFELTSKKGGAIKVTFNSTQSIRIYILDDKEYQNFLDKEPFTIIFLEDNIFVMNQDYHISSKGSFYIILENYFIFNDEAVVNIKVEVINDNSDLIFYIIIIILVVSLFIVLIEYLIYKYQKRKNKDEEIKAIIITKMKDLDDESNIIDFKAWLGNKLKIAKNIAAFCNSYVYTGEEGYIVFGVKDRKDLPENFTLKDRLIPLKLVLENSLKKTRSERTIENFKSEIIKIIERHLEPIPDSCFKIKNLNLNGYENIKEDFYVIVININKFPLSRPVNVKGHGYFIRSEGRNRKATDDDIIEITKKIERNK